MINAKTLEQAIADKAACDERGPWYPACGGTEKPFRVGHYTYQYMFQPSTRRHAYLCLETDMFLSDAEADKVLA